MLRLNKPHTGFKANAYVSQQTSARNGTHTKKNLLRIAFIHLPFSRLMEHMIIGHRTRARAPNQLAD